MNMCNELFIFFGLWEKYVVKIRIPGFRHNKAVLMKFFFCNL